jgi:hypothetical protein
MHVTFRRIGRRGARPPADPCRLARPASRPSSRANR